MFCPKCGKEIHDEAVICVNCGCSIDNKPAVNDERSIGLCILSFLIPLFGIIYWPVMHSKAPNRAKACGITAIVSWILGILLIGLGGL